MKPIIWLTGQPGSGKTTLANELRIALGYPCPFIIDGDDLRSIFANPNYSKEGRYENIRTAQRIAQYLQSKGEIAIVSLVAPYRELREELKAKATVLEVYLHTDEVRGREKFFAQDYEPPLNNFLDINTGDNIDDSTQKILAEYWSVAASSRRA